MVKKAAPGLRELTPRLETARTKDHTSHLFYQSLVHFIAYLLIVRRPRRTECSNFLLHPTPPFFFCVQFPFLYPHKCIGGVSGGESRLLLHSHSPVVRIEIGFCQT